MPYYKNANNDIFWFDQNLDQIDVPVTVDTSSLQMVEAAEANQLVNNAVSEFTENFTASLTYADNRRAEYPSIGEQLDDLYKSGIFSTEMSARIKAVKEKYPK